MKLNLLATFFLISSYLSSQQTVTTSGCNIESDQVSLSYTIGQLKVNTIEKVDSSILELDFIQGVQYAYIIDVFDCRDYNSIKISVFPNPTSSIVNISMEKLSDKLSISSLIIFTLLLNLFFKSFINPVSFSMIVKLL